MTSRDKILEILIEEGTKARAHFQIWWALRNLAIPKYLNAMNQLNYVEFFHASNSGHYTLFLLAISKIHDKRSDTACIATLKKMLKSEGKKATLQVIDTYLQPHESNIKKILNIRNKTVVHNDEKISRTKVYSANGISANTIRSVIDDSCHAINTAAKEFDFGRVIFESDRAETATLELLKTLDKQFRHDRAVRNQRP